jgi:thiaminase
MVFDGLGGYCDHEADLVFSRNADTNRAGYAYLMYMLFELYFATFAQFVSAFSPNAMAASIVSRLGGLGCSRASL